MDIGKLKKNISGMRLRELIELEEETVDHLKVLKQKDKILQHQIKKLTVKDQTQLLAYFRARHDEVMTFLNP